MRTLLLSGCALICFASPVHASIVDADKVTLGSLSLKADSIVKARIEASEEGTLRFVKMHALKGLAAELPAASLTSAADPMVAGQVGLLFLVRKGEQSTILSDEWGWVPNDAEAERFVSGYLRARNRDRAAVYSFLISNLSSPSFRVWRDTLRDLSHHRDSLVLAKGKALDRLLVASRRGIHDPMVADAALDILPLLPDNAGDKTLIQAAHNGVSSALLGPVARDIPSVISTLATSLQNRRVELSGKESLNIIRVLGQSGSPTAVPALLNCLVERALQEESARALAEIRDPKATAALKQVLANSPDLQSAAWAAVGLAFIGGDEAIGMLEFTALNHTSSSLRAFVKSLTKDPAVARAKLAKGLTLTDASAVKAPAKIVAPLGKARAPIIGAPK